MESNSFICLMELETSRAKIVEKKTTEEKTVNKIVPSIVILLLTG